MIKSHVQALRRSLMTYEFITMLIAHALTLLLLVIIIDKYTAIHISLVKLQQALPTKESDQSFCEYLRSKYSHKE